MGGVTDAMRALHDHGSSGHEKVNVKVFEWQLLGVEQQLQPDNEVKESS